MSDTATAAAAASSASSSLDTAFSSPACSANCVITVSLSSAGLLVGALIAAVIVVRRRRHNSSSTSSKSTFNHPAASRDVEVGKFDKYKPIPLSAQAPPPTQTVLSRLDADEDLVDVLDLFDAPAMAHLRSPGARRLTNNISTWGPEWRLLNEPVSSTTRRDRGPSSASDQIGIQTMLEQDSLSIRGSSMYVARTPVLVPRNLDHLQSLPRISVNALTNQVSAAVRVKNGSTASAASTQCSVGAMRHSDRPSSLYRDKRPPPLQLARSNTSTTANNNRCSYISIKSVPSQTNALNAAVLEKPALSPITPLITPSIRSPVGTTPGKMRVPGSSRRTSISRGDTMW